MNMVTNGVEAMEFFDQKNKHFDAILPDLILLDLNLPKERWQAGFTRD